MRIISGSQKGKKLLEPKDDKTRPLKDLTKESIFNIINHSNKFKINIIGADILDLFAGVGSFGIECLSRGARNVTFIEYYKKVLIVLKKNLNNLEFKTNFKIIEKNLYDTNIFSNIENKFDIIFLDPPYKDKNFEKILKKIDDQKILKNQGIIILHRHKNEKYLVHSNMKILEEKNYGISNIKFLSFLN